ncbi:tryptophan 2,3-dioxygenase [Jidongwangia harbinensis]|uniref:tryptophan 2,3-dioxygenase n=1 Tax=Jidongwangia harbinensis TaxID=2878561 RepID=UPI001CD94645|nr:tryptophan 2,3-dioxygenase family protein [Jidongwangia harbinensis]MCA2219508.1 tryptophan 2,3-dioxygenase [Jidongwangia harbinensis]
MGAARAPIHPLTEGDREDRYKKSGGQPLLEFGDAPNPYADYVGTPMLLALQNPRTDAAGEPSFLVMTQIMELLFKLVYTEARRARDYLESDQLNEALWVLRRTHKIMNVLAGTWDVLAALSPAEYNEFRDELGEGSGFQSPMYRQLEFILGNKHRSLLKPHQGEQAAHRKLSQTLAEPSIYDAAVRLLRRREFPIPEHCVERDWTEPRDADDEIIQAWRMIYGDPARYHELHSLAESLVDLAYLFGRWRFSHLLTVERIIGGRVGTGGTSGVGWLRKAADHRFFDELWTVRSVG